MKGLIKRILKENEEEYTVNINGINCTVEWVRTDGFDLVFRPLITAEEYKDLITTLKNEGIMDTFRVTSSKRDEDNKVTHVGAIDIQLNLRKLVTSFLSITTETDQFNQFYQ